MNTITPNYFYRAYSLGRTHTGMLAYLCDIYNSGKQKPLRDVLNGLGLHELELPPQIGVQFEFKQADLGLFDGDHCFLLIEMKVDDREGWKKASSNDVFDTSKGWYENLGKIDAGTHYRQTKLYQHRAHQSNLWAMHAEKNGIKGREKYNGVFEPGSSPEVLLVTLGVGEYGLLKVDENDKHPAKHIKLKQWTSAFAKTSSTNDAVCIQYVAALEQEAAARELIIDWFEQGIKSEKETQVRTSLHPIIWRMAHVVKGIKAPSNWPSEQVFYTIVKTVGGGDVMVEMPTTKDLFENMPAPLYMELKLNGYLHLKLYGVKLGVEQQQVLLNATNAALTKLVEKYDGIILEADRKKTITKAHNSLTVSKFDVGLNSGIYLKEDTNLNEVRVRISSAMGLYVDILSYLNSHLL